MSTNLELFPNPIKDKTSSTFIDNMKLPIHGWFRYTAGFSADWVRSVFNDHTDKHTVLDPFVGSGTVIIEGQLNNKTTYGVEAHRLVHGIAEAKLNWNVDIELFSQLANTILKDAKENPTSRTSFPALMQRIYPEQTLKDLFSLKEAYERNSLDDRYSKLIWFILTAILRISSPAGTAQWQYVLPGKSKAKVLLPYNAYENKLGQMIADMELIQSQERPLGEAILIKGDSRSLDDVPSNSIDLVITSPPYANNYDYADATRIELTFWHEIDNWGQLQSLVKPDIIRACTQHVAHIKNEVDSLFSSKCLDPIRDELKTQFDELAKIRLNKGGKKNYHLMALAYFKDLGDTFVALRRVCKKDAKLCFVIGDSAPYGIYLPVDQWLGELALHAGFNKYSFEKTRDRNVKWKNRKHTVPLKEGRLWIE